MQMEAGLDTGPMLHVRKTAIEENDTAQTLHDRLAQLGAEALLESLPELAAETLTPEPQDDSQSNYARKLDKAEAVVDWSRPAIELQRLIRAFNPWPVAQTTLAGKTLRLWQAELENSVSATPGSIVEADKDGIVVACGEQGLRLTQVQIAGSKPVSAADFINGHSQLCIPGTVLGAEA
jgi:methionyl-tRNA formyltransferase